MRKTVLKSMIATLAVSVAPMAAFAEDMAVGESAFAERCAVCHGASGGGDGAVGELFAQKPKNLRLIAKENGGTFPFEDVMKAIDGRSDVQAHGGGTAMPVWGEYLMIEALEDRNINPKDAASIVNGRVLELTHYIMSIQAD